MAKETKTKLNPRQERFCILYATDREFFCNGTQTYIEVFNPVKKGNWYKTARTLASRLLTKVDICERINGLLEEQGMNDVFADKQLLAMMTQHADFSAKIKAIQEYNKLKGRITDHKDITGKVIVLNNKWEKMTAKSPKPPTLTK